MTLDELPKATALAKEIGTLRHTMSRVKHEGIELAIKSTNSKIELTKVHETKLVTMIISDLATMIETKEAQLRQMGVAVP